MTPTLYQCPVCLSTVVAYVPPRTPPLCRSPRHSRIEQMHQIDQTGEVKP